MKKIHQLSWGALFFVGLSTLISLPSFGQGVILKEFKDASQSHVGMGHGEKCGHTLLEIQQEKQIKVKILLLLELRQEQQIKEMLQLLLVLKQEGMRKVEILLLLEILLTPYLETNQKL